MRAVRPGSLRPTLRAQRLGGSVEQRLQHVLVCAAAWVVHCFDVAFPLMVGQRAGQRRLRPAVAGCAAPAPCGGECVALLGPRVHGPVRYAACGRRAHRAIAVGVEAPRRPVATAPRRRRLRGARPLRGRVRCAARSTGARPNSLRGLRPLRSDSGRESDGTRRAARAARGPALLTPAPYAGAGGAQPPLAATTCSTRARRNALATILPA